MPACWHHLEGKCRFGNKCRFSHDATPAAASPERSSSSDSSSDEEKASPAAAAPAPGVRGSKAGESSSSSDSSSEEEEPPAIECYAKRAELDTKNVWHHFPTKPELVRAKERTYALLSRLDVLIEVRICARPDLFYLRRTL